MSSTHRKKIARALAKATGLTYQQALARVVEADNAGLLPHTLGDAGITEAAKMLIEHTAAPETPVDLLQKALDKPYGLIVVAGETGTGKSTLIYQSISDLFARPTDEPLKIITIESPIGQVIKRQPDGEGIIQQIPYGPDGYTLDKAHRMALRQDPDVVVYDELRSAEHVNRSIDAAMTGHLVLTAMHHVVDVAGVIHRLTIDAEPLLIADALVAVVMMRRDGDRYVAETTLIDDDIRAAILSPANETFADGLRKVLREPPEARLVGESLDITRRNPWPFPRIDLSADLLAAMDKPGLVVVAGATMSGKSTVLYEALRDRLRGSNRIVTIENPVEQYLEPQPGDRGVISQRQTGRDHKTFERGLWHAWRSDPDVLLIGEVREQEHVDAVIRAASTGHLVLTAVHAFGPSAVVHRLIHMGADAANLADTLNAVVTTWREKGQFFSATWTVSDEVRTLIREYTDSTTFDADLRAAFGEPPKAPADPFGYGGRASRSQRVLDTKKATPGTVSQPIVDRRSGHLLITGPTGSGKTVLVREAMRLHREQGEQVLLIDTVKTGADHTGLTDKVAATQTEVASMLHSVRADSRPTLLILEQTDQGIEPGSESEGMLLEMLRSRAGLRVVATTQHPLPRLHHGGKVYGLWADSFDTRVLLGQSTETFGALLNQANDPLVEPVLRRGWAWVEDPDQNITVMNVWGAPEHRPFGQADRLRIQTGLRRVAVMMRMGVQDQRWFADTARTMTGEARLVFERLAAARLAGSTCTAAMAAEPHTFAAWALSIVQAGEETGQLAEAFEQIAEVF